MSMFGKLFPPITAAKSFSVAIPAQEAHDRVLAALNAGGYTSIQDAGADIHAEHGEVALFTYGTVSTDIGLTLAASPSDLYPITVDVAFHATDDGCQVSVNASYIKPVTYLGAPKKGPEAAKWHEACDSAVATVVDCLKDSLA